MVHYGKAVVLSMCVAPILLLSILHPQKGLLAYTPSSLLGGLPILYIIQLKLLLQEDPTLGR